MSQGRAVSAFRYYWIQYQVCYQDPGLFHLLNCMAYSCVQALTMMQANRHRQPQTLILPASLAKSELLVAPCIIMATAQGDYLVSLGSVLVERYNDIVSLSNYKHYFFNRREKFYYQTKVGGVRQTDVVKLFITYYRADNSKSFHFTRHTYKITCLS